jgi:hypothetical protein
MMRLAAPAVLALACALAAGTVANAAQGRPKDLWATVNVCDTPEYPDMMGVRASMPGDGDHTKMYMRFAAQYFDRSKQLWSDVKGDGLSKWIFVGSGLYARRQGGYTFAFDPPAVGKKFVLRGAVDFKWVKRGRIVRTAHVVTKGAHPGTAGADPKDFSASLCEIS